MKFINKLLKNHSLFVIRFTLVATMTMIFIGNLFVFKYALTGEILHAILYAVLILLLIRINKEVQ